MIRISGLGSGWQFFKTQTSDKKNRNNQKMADDEKHAYFCNAISS